MTRIAILGSVILACLLMTDISAQTPNLQGIWEGSLNVGATTLRLVFNVTRGADGSLAAKLDSPDQGAMGLPVDAVSLDGRKVLFEMKSFGAAYEGTLNAESTEIAGNWKQGGLSLPLTMKRVEKAAGLNRPQEPKKPYPYDEEEVVYQNGRAGIRLAGTMTMPRDKRPSPAVILITGSGPQDRNETIFGHKPFLVLADHLTRQGIAVLRVDDRGVGGSTGNTAASTTEDFTEDVLAGIEFLKSRKEIDPKRIGLIGHSEGGIIAPIVAAKSPDVAFIVLMAGTGLPGEQILYLQGELIARASGAPDEAIAENRKVQERIFSIIKSSKDQKDAEGRLNALRDELTVSMSEEQKKAGADKMLDAQLKGANTAWFRYFITYDPKTVLSKVKCPVLAVNGELDLQVPYKQNLAAIDAALKAGGNKDASAVSLPRLNHLFQTATTGAPSEYGTIEETIAPQALKTISDWIGKHTGK